MALKIMTTKGPAILYKGRLLSAVPKTYKKICILGHDIGNAYNPGTLTLYKNRQGILKYEIYRDGALYPFYGTFEFREDKEVDNAKRS